MSGQDLVSGLLGSSGSQFISIASMTATDGQIIPNALGAAAGFDEALTLATHVALSAVLARPGPSIRGLYTVSADVLQAGETAMRLKAGDAHD